MSSQLTIARTRRVLVSAGRVLMLEFVGLSVHSPHARVGAALIAAASCLAGATMAAIRVRAQLERGEGHRSAGPFDAYDLDGDTTLDAIRRLAPSTAEGRGLTPQQRLARVRAATDLWLVSLLDPRRAALEERLAGALQTPSGSIAAALRSEINAADGDVSAELAAELRKAIAVREAIAAERPLSFAATRGVRRDALLLYVVGKGIADGDDRELARWYDDPCAEGAECPPPSSIWTASSRSVVAALVDASSALARLEQAAEAGDPFARAALEPARAADRGLDAHVHHPSPMLPDAVDLSPAAYDDGEHAGADLLVIAGPEHASITRVARVRARAGRAEAIDEGPGVLPDVISVPLPAASGEGAAFGPLAESLRTSGAAQDAQVAVGAAAATPAERLQQILATMVRADREPRALVRRATDGTLRAAPIRVVAEDAARDEDTVSVELSPNGYAVRGGGVDDTEIPRIAEASLGALDDAALDALIGSVPGRRVVIRAIGALPSVELIDTAFYLAEGGDRVALVGQ